MRKRRILIALIIVAMTSLDAYAQLREYRIHDRGLLHETVFNTGEIGRAYQYGEGGFSTPVPLMEYPAPSRGVVDGIEYDGQHNSIGGGVWVSVDSDDFSERQYAYSGGVGENDPYQINGQWSYPQRLEKIENYPVLDDGSLNPSYDADEAEEIIIARWATPTGLTITRTSRAWSYPGYDSFIIYEYEIEHTGDRNGNPSTVESTETLFDVTVGFSYGFAPSMFGYERTTNRWHHHDYERNDQRARFDPDRWLKYNLHMNGLPDPNYYEEWAQTGRMGGALNAPAAVGFSMLYFDTDHLTRKGERSNVQVLPLDSTRVFDENDRIKQPWINRVETANLDETKARDYLRVDNRRASPWNEMHDVPEDWIGRGNYNHRQTRKAVGRFIIFGPYTLEHGETIRFSMAEVAGYGAATKEQTDAGLTDWGGSCGEDCGEEHSFPSYPVPNWTEPITYGGSSGEAFSYGSTYLSEYNYPEWVHPQVRTIRDVTDRAIEAYTGNPPEFPYWPEEQTDYGVYQIPVPIPAPAIELTSDVQANNLVRWNNQIENFTHPRQTGEFSHYEVYRSEHPLGPWSLLATVLAGDSEFTDEDGYIFIDGNTRVGESYYYTVLSVDENGNKSGKTNMTRFETFLGGTETLKTVRVVPNPFVVRSGFAGGGEADDRIGFYNLPRRATIRVYSYSGQLVRTIEHESGEFSTAWLQITRNDQDIASGVYFYVVTTPEGEETNGKFVIIK